MGIKFSEDVVPISNLKVNPGSVVRRVNENRRAVLVTSRGRGKAVVQSLRDFEEEAEEREFMRAVVRGLCDLKEGRELNLAAVKKKLNLK